MRTLRNMGTIKIIEYDVFGWTHHTHLDHANAFHAFLTIFNGKKKSGLFSK